VNILADSYNQTENWRKGRMATTALITSPATNANDNCSISVNDVCLDIETVKGVIAFLVDVGCTGAFSRTNGQGISQDGEVGLTYILRSIADELDKISSCCAANLQPKATN
jgi:hypothetical protein